MFGSDLLYAALNVSAVTSLLDTYQTYPALFNDNLIPQDFEGNKSINFYMAVSYNAATEVPEYTYSVNCRADNYFDSRALAEAVKNEINRKSYNDYFIVVAVISTIPPQDDTDNYNTPVSVTIKTR